MKNHIITLSLREIRIQIFRFIALIVMAFLGVFVFVGLKSTAPDMIKSLDVAYDESQVYDLRLSSSMNLTDEDISRISSKLMENNIEAYIEGSKSLDFEISSSKDEHFVINVESITKNVNKINLEEGRLPQNQGEIVVESNLLKAMDLKIGDKLVLDSILIEYNIDDVANNEYTIVGTVKANKYINSDSISYDRGKTSIGNGTINFYSYVLEDAFNEYEEYESANDVDISLLLKKGNLNSVTNGYTNLYIFLPMAKEYVIDSKKYNTIVDNVSNIIGDIKDELMLNRKTKVLKEANAIRTKINQLTELMPNLEEQVIPYLELIDDYFKLDLSYKLFTREDYNDYYNYINDAQSIDNLAGIFPAVFYAVAILVSIVSMRRMVNDDRGLIGTLKSQGFSNCQILTKYIIFSAMATITGCILGFLSGMIIIPKLIWNIYTILFSIPKFYLFFDWFNIIIGIFIAFVCIVGVSIFTVLSVLREKPSDLLRPKAPKASKKILLERIKPIWNRMSFSLKITVRNLSRYKKRCLVTIIGIVGCSALMLTGFGLRDAIQDIPSKQYSEINTYDVICYLNPLSSYDFEIDGVKNVSFYHSLDIKIDDYEATLMVVEDIASDALFMDYHDVETKEQIDLTNDGIIITDKLASLLDLENDMVQIEIDNKQFDVKVCSTCEYYIHHYVFITKELYESLGYKYSRDICYLDINESKKIDIRNYLMENDIALNVSFVSDLVDEAKDVLGSLNQVVVILIILSMMLSFTVLYNLSNINISERRREISTLKVLGFYDGEVDRYITRENIIITIFGIFIGLFVGYFLALKVISTVEIEYVRFIYDIKFTSFLFTVILSCLFTAIVNIIAHFSLKRIDMIDSLKSVE